MSTSSPSKNLVEKFLFVVLFFCGLGVRVWGVFDFSSHSELGQFVPPNDSFYFLRSASEFVFGMERATLLSFFPSDFYFRFLVTCFTIFGNELLSIQLIQIAYSCVGIICLFSLAKILRYKLSALFILFFWSFSKDWILVDIQFLKYSITLSLICISVYTSVLYQKNGRKYLLGLSLVAICLLSYIRPIYFLAVGLYFLNRFRSPVGKMIYLFCGFLVSVLLVIFLGSTKIKNHIGIHVYYGFSQNSTGYYQNMHYVEGSMAGHFNEALFLNSELLKKYNQFSWIKDFWLQKSFSRIVESPLQSFYLFFKKMIKSVIRPDIAPTPNLYYQTQNFKSLRVGGFLRLEWLIGFGVLGFITVLLKKGLKIIGKHLLLGFFFIPWLFIGLTCLERMYPIVLLPLAFIFGLVFFNEIAFNRENFPKLAYVGIFVLLFLGVQDQKRRNYYRTLHKETLSKKINPSDVYMLRVSRSFQELDKIRKFKSNPSILTESLANNAFSSLLSVGNWIDALNFVYWKVEVINNGIWKVEDLLRVARAYNEKKAYYLAVPWYRAAMRQEDSHQIKQEFKNTYFEALSSFSPDSY